MNLKKIKKHALKVKRRRIRRKLRRSGLLIYRSLFIAKIKTRIIARRTMSIWWVFKEPEGYMVLNIDGIERFNQARKKSNLSKIRIRDANKMAVYRFPKKGWNIIKTNGYGKSKARGNSRIRKTH